jgi:hypothetical protein
MKTLSPCTLLHTNYVSSQTKDSCREMQNSPVHTLVNIYCIMSGTFSSLWLHRAKLAAVYLVVVVCYDDNQWWAKLQLLRQRN